MDKAPNIEARKMFQRSGILAKRHNPLYKWNLRKIIIWRMTTMGIVKILTSQFSNGNEKLNLAHHENCQANTDINKS